MKPLLLSFLFLINVSCIPYQLVDTVPTTPALPTLKITQTVLTSIVPISIQTVKGGIYRCTAFNIAPHTFVTAAHCIEWIHRFPDAVLYVKTQRAAILKENETVDLAVIVSDIPVPALSIRAKPLKLGEAVQAAGYGLGLSFPFVSNHTVLSLNYRIPPESYPGTIFMNSFIEGMSGGPIYDANGHVVGVIQRATEMMGYGISSDTLTRFLRI